MGYAYYLLGSYLGFGLLFDYGAFVVNHSYKVGDLVVINGRDFTKYNGERAVIVSVDNQACGVICDNVVHYFYPNSLIPVLSELELEPVEARLP